MEDFQKRDLTVLDDYIASVIDTATTRHASEDRLDCPPIVEAVSAERIMRTTLHDMFDTYVSIDTDGTPTLGEVKSYYWDGAQHVTSAHGAKPGFSLDDYFHVDQDRYYDAVKTSVVEQYEPDSIPVVLFEAVDEYQRNLGLDSVNAARIMLTLFKRSMPLISDRAQSFAAKGLRPEEASREAVRDFADNTVPMHIAFLYGKGIDQVSKLPSMVNKSSTYPDIDTRGKRHEPLLISTDDATGFSKVSRIQERPYTPQELAMADKMYDDPTMQKAVLLFHLSYVDYAAKYLERNPDRLQHSLEPFTEIFVATEAGVYVPNPKLIRVIGNNTLPAVARVLINEGVSADDLTSSFLQDGALLAKKLHVFQTQIGQFNQSKRPDSLIDMHSIFTRTCPAMKMFTDAMAQQLPVIYESCR